ncbi:phosphoglycerate mutase family protein [Teladorsagia circumcincta]|uniref:Phosphoglycerate mutase family protein n=1 Tax=Teladorsagia circumcincta TaxID=45464 RepID=A0A2G9V3C3_TELCI|nr:phosphoglycerate mutase family protein [Teladorsagia circumcincta]
MVHRVVETDPLGSKFKIRNWVGDGQIPLIAPRPTGRTGVDGSIRYLFKIVYITINVDISPARGEDNVNPDWQRLPEAKGLKIDNPMLSARGRKQARECAARFRDVNIAHIFASPFDRTMETASIIAECKDLLVKPEAGLGEVLTECSNPPGFWSTKRLKRKFIWVDADYEPVYEKVLRFDPVENGCCTTLHRLDGMSEFGREN